LITLNRRWHEFDSKSGGLRGCELKGNLVFTIPEATRNKVTLSLNRVGSRRTTACGEGWAYRQVAEAMGLPRVYMHEELSKYGWNNPELGKLAEQRVLIAEVSFPQRKPLPEGAEALVNVMEGKLLIGQRYWYVDRNTHTIIVPREKAAAHNPFSWFGKFIRSAALLGYPTDKIICPETITIEVTN